MLYCSIRRLPLLVYLSDDNAERDDDADNVAIVDADLRFCSQRELSRPPPLIAPPTPLFATVATISRKKSVEGIVCRSLELKSTASYSPEIISPASSGGRVNGQYIIEGLSSGFMFVLGGLGIIFLDLAVDRHRARSIRISFALFGISAVVIAYLMCTLFIRIKIPGYLG
ncbi:hypothetical protein KSP40_PGU021862 [Platanthera guangdongensis]|uniref:Uncharacterized protein n=1 Tax=Platanthera guangdongensis TaxID=2320717 RepID=A0ABR2LCP1_9ASPA